MYNMNWSVTPSAWTIKLIPVKDKVSHCISISIATRHCYIIYTLSVNMLCDNQQNCASFMKVDPI